MFVTKRFEIIICRMMEENLAHKRVSVLCTLLYLCYSFFATGEYSPFFIKTKRITRRSYERTLVAQITNPKGSGE